MRRIAKLCCGWIFVMIMHCLLAVNASATEMAMFPMQYINISQGVNETYSHPGRLAIDICGKDTGKDAFYAPFTGTVKKIYDSDNVVWLESNSPVQFADGTVDYMTIMCMHDDDISDLYVGKVINQGDLFLTEGMAGSADGNHIHLECGKGKFSGSGWYKNSYGKWCINNGVNPWDALYLSSDTIIYNDYGYNWRTVSSNISAPSNITISADKTQISVGESVTFTYTIDNATSKSIGIDIAGGSRYHTIGVNASSGSVSYTFTETGTYCVITEGSNSAGYNCCDGVYITVSDKSAPTNVGMVCNYENMTVKPGTAIQLSYWYINATGFDLIIYKDDVEYEHFYDVSNPFYYVPSEGGNYLAVGYAKNSVGSTESNRRAFRVSEYTPPIIPNGTYSILSAVDTSYALNVYARDASDNNTIIVWQDPTQKFDIEYLGGGLYKITSAVTGKVLDAYNAQMESETDLVQYTWNGWIGQKWKIERSDDGYFYFINCLNGLYIDLYGNNASNGTNVQLYEFHAGTNQKWLLSPLVHNVTFDANGGDVSTADKSVVENSTYGDLPVPQRTGYTFKGWYTQKNDGVKITSETIVNTTSNITLYAQWEEIPPYVKTTLESSVKKAATYYLVSTDIVNCTQSGVYAAVLYDRDGIPTWIVTEEVTDGSPSVAQLRMPSLGGNTNGYIKVFFWDSFDSMIPLAESEIIEL